MTNYHTFIKYDYQASGENSHNNGIVCNNFIQTVDQKQTQLQ